MRIILMQRKSQDICLARKSIIIALCGAMKDKDQYHMLWRMLNVHKIEKC